MRADVAMDGEHVAAIAVGLGFEARRYVEPSGRLLIPGGVDTTFSSL